MRAAMMGGGATILRSAHSEQGSAVNHSIPAPFSIIRRAVNDGDDEDHVPIIRQAQHQTSGSVWSLFTVLGDKNLHLSVTSEKLSQLVCVCV